MPDAPPDAPPDDTPHARCVDDWLGRVASGVDGGAHVDLLEAALRALWARANVTLGEVTLTAIVDRVLYNARERFPVLASLELAETREISCQGLRAAVDDIPVDTLREGVRFTLIELLTVLGNLTADILTPELHAELAKVDLRSRTATTPGLPGREGQSR
jgi:hypothetical protein